MMVRWIVVWVTCAVAFCAGGAVAHANPPGPPPPPPCSFTLSPPVRDGDTVTATVESTGCAALAVPYSSVACLQPGAGALRCEQARGNDPAQVRLPYTPGVTMIATGRGCAGWVGLPPGPDCQLLGPDSATP
jgi:hypothetical protein